MATSGFIFDNVDKINRALDAALAQPETAAVLLAAGIETLPGTPTDLDRYVRAEHEGWGRVIRTGIKAA